MTDRTTTTTAAQSRARTEALGDLEGPCCRPAESDPCTSCSPPDLHPDDIAWEPTDADTQWYQRWLAEHDGDITPGRSFAQKIADVANVLGDSEDAVVSWVGKEHVGKLYDLVAFLGATSIEDFIDKREALLDCARDAAEARAALAAR